MSLRPEISGFSLQKMFDVLGCKDEEVLRRVTDEFDSKVTFRNPSLKAEAHNVLRCAIFDYDGNRWPDLEVEGEPHVFAAIVLAATWARTPEDGVEPLENARHLGFHRAKLSSIFW